MSIHCRIVTGDETLIKQALENQNDIFSPDKTVVDISKLLEENGIQIGVDTVLVVANSGLIQVSDNEKPTASYDVANTTMGLRLAMYKGKGE